MRQLRTLRQHNHISNKINDKLNLNYAEIDANVKK